MRSRDQGSEKVSQYGACVRLWNLPTHPAHSIPVRNRVYCHVSLDRPHVHSGCTLRDGHPAILDARSIQLSHLSGPVITNHGS